MDKDIKEVVYSGLIAGAVFILLQVVLGALFLHSSPWEPPRMIAAVFMGRRALSPETVSNARIILTGTVVHIFLSVVFTAIISWIIRKVSKYESLIYGIMAGLILYSVNFYIIAPGFFPWFEQETNWVNFVDHMVFGAIAAFSYKEMRIRDYNCVAC